MPHKTKADRSLDEKLTHLLRDGRVRPPQFSMAATAEAAERARREQSRLLPFDVPAAEQLLGQYGTYLELIGEDKPLGEKRVFQWPAEPAEQEQPA